MPVIHLNIEEIFLYKQSLVNELSIFPENWNHWEFHLPFSPSGENLVYFPILGRQFGSPFIRRVFLNTTTCEPLPKITGLLNHNPEVGAWDCAFDELARVGMPILVWQPLSQWQGQGKQVLHYVPLTHWGWREKNLLFQIIAMSYHQSHSSHSSIYYMYVYIFLKYPVKLGYKHKGAIKIISNEAYYVIVVPIIQLRKTSHTWAVVVTHL